MSTFWVMTPAGWAPVARDLDLGETGIPMKLRTKYGWAVQAPYPQGNILAVKEQAGFVPVMYMYPAIEQPFVVYLPGEGELAWTIGAGQTATSVIGPDGKRYVVIVPLSIAPNGQSNNYMATGATSGGGVWSGRLTAYQNQIDGGEDATGQVYELSGRTSTFTPFKAAAAIAYGEDHKTPGRTIKHYRIVVDAGVVADDARVGTEVPLRAFRRYDIPLTTRADVFTGKMSPAVKDVPFDDGMGELLLTVPVDVGHITEGLWQSPNYTRAEFAALPDAVFQVTIGRPPDSSDGLGSSSVGGVIAVRVNMYYD